MAASPATKTIQQAGYPPLSSAKRWLGQILKFGLAAGVVVYLISHGDIAWEPLRASLGAWEYSLPAFLILAATPLGQFWRWQSLLRAGGVLLSNREVFSYLMISKFFNMAFPGYVSGDILRGFYVFRRAKEDTEESAAMEGGNSPAIVASIVFDRIAGLLPLLVLCLAGLLGTLWHPLPMRLVSAVALVAGSGLLVILLLFAIAYRLPQPPQILLRVSRWLHCEESFRFLHEITHYYVRNWKLMAVISALSFLTQGAGLASFVLFGLALKVQIPVFGYMVLAPIGLIITAIPVTPAGLGVGQVAFLSLFHMIGTSQGANLYTLYAASYVVINLSGALLYVSSRIPALLPQTANSAKIDEE